MIRLLRSKKNTILIFCLSLSILCAALGMYKDIYNVGQYMMNDFRSRVVATRLLNDGIDPYFYKWSPGDSELYLDPRDFPDRPISRVTVPPTALLINDLLMEFSYSNQKRVWLVLQWAALLACFSIISVKLNSRNGKVFWILGLTLFASSWFWRFHVDAGQMYVFYILLLLSSYCILSRDKTEDSFFAGLIIGFTASLRPNDIVFCIPFFVAKKMRTLSGSVIGFVSNIVLSVVLWGAAPWLSYFRAINLHEKVHLGWLNSVKPNSLIYGVTQVEGVAKFDIIPRFLYSDSSLQKIFNVSSPVLLIALSIILSIYMYFLFYNRKKLISVEIIMFTGITAVVISEFFIPASRYAYYDIIWLFPLGLLLGIYEKRPGINKVINLSIVIFAIAILSLGETFPIIARIVPLALACFIVWLSTVILRDFQN